MSRGADEMHEQTGGISSSLDCIESTNLSNVLDLSGELLGVLLGLLYDNS